MLTTVSRISENFSPTDFFYRLYQKTPNFVLFETLDVGVLKALKKFELINEKRFYGSGMYVSYPAALNTYSMPHALDQSFNMRCSHLSVYKAADEIIVTVLTSERGKTGIALLYSNEKKKEANALETVFKRYIPKPESRACINLLFQNGADGFYLRERPIDETFTTDISLNYGSSFELIYKGLLKSLERETKGLYLLSSDPGCGKTSLIKNIVKDLPDQKIVFLPPSMTGALSDPSFLPFLSEEAIDLIVIEDAENSLRNRDEMSSSHVSSILNMTDGILGDIIKIKILATFNTDKNSIDKALLRKGRLKFFHEFGALDPVESDRLLVKLGRSPQNKSLTLAEIYNQEETGFEVKKTRAMGFGR